MCGICGIVDYDGELGPAAERERQVAAMLARLRHRGPDGSGLLSRGPATLGAVRLAIQDRARGRQPLTAAGGDLAAVFNGEIYNHQELRTELERQGAAFATHCDTEVLLALFAAEGEAAPARLRGMFAYAVWDGAAEALSLARDRCGEKPLVYWQRGRLFAFASEINALLALPFVPRRPSRLGLHYGLHYVHVPAPHTAFEGLHKLRPATALTVRREGATSRRYWTLRFEPRYGEGGRDECVRDVAATLADTVALVGRCDEVPRGAFLSGGLDSSSIVACLARAEPGLPTFRVGAPDGGAAERAAARELSARYGTRHQEIPLQREHLRGVRELVAAYAEPTGTLVALDAHILSAHAARTVSVALAGSGADEIFSGYEDARAFVELDRQRAQWRHLQAFFEGAPPAGLPDDLRALAGRMEAFGRADPSRLYADAHLARGRAFTGLLYGAEMRELARQHDVADLLVEAYHQAGTDQLANTTLHQQLMVACQYSLVDHGDISGMAHALEVRSPFLDVRLLELAAGIPPAWRVGRHDGQDFGKMILREAVAGLLPESCRFGRKSGFGSTVPYADWMRRDWSALLNRDALAASGLFDMDRVDRLADDSPFGEPERAHLMFHLITLAEWHAHYFP